MTSVVMRGLAGFAEASPAAVLWPGEAFCGDGTRASIFF
jgi:hypothetical protein